ncbi:MAG: hypothetical protein H6937_08000 [Burkholderiales bacterium]|nr:hypothetical protein [Burkholderiales bacterium]MDR4517013.1 hypothetical protein [Nitrosomonas sp.]
MNVDFISLPSSGNGNLERFNTAINPKTNDINQHVGYDLIILDHVCESPLLGTAIQTLEWKKRQEMFFSLSKKIHEQGSIIIFSNNATDVRNPAVFFYALTNLFLNTFFSGSFAGQVTRELKRAGFSKFDCFYLYPEINTFSQLISDSRKAFGDAIKSKYFLPLKIYRRPKLWLRWLGCYLQLDRCLLSSQMIWARK